MSSIDNSVENNFFSYLLASIKKLSKKTKFANTMPKFIFSLREKNVILLGAKKVEWNVFVVKNFVSIF